MSSIVFPIHSIPPAPFDYPSRDTLFSALLAAMHQYGRYQGQVRSDQCEDQKPGAYSYHDLVKTTLALGRLASKVTQPGEHVGVLMPNMIVSVGLMLGLSAFARLPCMLNYTSGSEGMQSACHLAGIRTILTSRVFLEKAGLLDQVALLRGVTLFYLEDLRARFDWRDKIWLMAYALRFPLRAVPKGDPEAPAVVLFTSGSEGKPKGVVLSHRALLANAAQMLARIRIGPEDAVLNVLPIFHSFGLTAGTLIPLLSGARLVLYTNPLHYKIIPELVRAKRCTLLFGTSTFLKHYAHSATADDFKTLKYVVAGAEKLATPVRQLWRDNFGIDILEGYGATEAAPVLAVNHPSDNRAGSVGRLLAGVEAQILPVAGIEQGGELHVRGPNIMSGYYLYDAPQTLVPPHSAAGAGWHNTGDVVSVDADGFITLQGRLKRFAKVAGEMVSLEVVEIIARAASTEALHAASSISDATRGELIVLFTTDSVLTREQLAAAARGLGYPEIALPKKIRVVETLPLMGAGKIDYVRLQEQASEC